MIDIERLASEAGFTVYNGCCDGITADLKRFAALVRNEVLEEAAKQADEACGAMFCHGDKEGAEIAMALRDAIRALKVKT